MVKIRAQSLLVEEHEGVLEQQHDRRQRLSQQCNYTPHSNSRLRFFEGSVSLLL
jgi:hypothetical protein